MARSLMKIACFLVSGVSAFAQTSDDRAAVRQAALNYVTGIYECKPALIQQSVAANLAKRGYRLQPDGTFSQQLVMSYEQLLEFARDWNKDGTRDVSIKEVTVGDVLEQTATASVRAHWGIDHMQLAKIDGTWKIVNILWQTLPPVRQVSPTAYK